jgi:hypothetical protein
MSGAQKIILIDFWRQPAARLDPSGITLPSNRYFTRIDDDWNLTHTF